MYKVLTIGGKDYKLEYTIEASLYEECVEKLINLYGSMMAITNPEESLKGLEGEKKEMAEKALLSSVAHQAYGIPQIALTLFYAGLMEYHGNGRNGDKSVTSKDDAKAIIYEYFNEHKDDGLDTFADVLTICVNQMTEDDFFRRTGLTKLMAQGTEALKSNRAPRRTKTKASAK